MFTEITIARMLTGWLLVLMMLIGFMTYNNKNGTRINVGPSNSLVIFGALVDTNEKYIGVVVLCVVNSAIRVMNSNIIHAWVINNIQDTKIYFKVNESHAYEITAIHAVYTFVDWYFYMNIILSQIDLFLIEMGVDLVMAILTTRHYLNVKEMSETIKPENESDCSVKNYILTGQTDTEV